MSLKKIIIIIILASLTLKKCRCYGVWYKGHKYRNEGGSLIPADPKNRFSLYK